MTRNRIDPARTWAIAWSPSTGNFLVERLAETMRARVLAVREGASTDAILVGIFQGRGAEKRARAVAAFLEERQAKKWAARWGTAIADNPAEVWS